MSTKTELLPSEERVRQMVDQVITPERADAEARPFCELMMMFASPEDDETWHLANVAARHAFSKTAEFDEAFWEFAGPRPRPEAAKSDEENDRCIQPSNVPQ